MLINKSRKGKKREREREKETKWKNNNKKAAVKRPLKSWLDF